MILAATGHRPDKLGGYSPAAENRRVNLALAVLTAEQPETMISGMALGWDMAIAEAAYLLNIPFHAYIPFAGQESRWPATSQRLYNNLIKHAAKVVVCCPGGYSPDKMQRRNERMVKDSDKIVALWNGDNDGGTANCVRYAKLKGKLILNVWEQWEETHG